MRDKIRAGVIGVGHMGQYHAQIYAALTEVELVGIADIDPIRASTIATKYQTHSYTDYHDLLASVDIVSIAVPTSSHYPVARDFLLAGVHVLLEKPVARTMEEARDLFRLAESQRLVLHIGHVERFNGAVQALGKVLRDPWLIESRRLSPFAPRMKDDGVVLDIMIHDIDIILNLVASPIHRLQALGKSIYTDSEDMANVHVSFHNGCMANIIASRATQTKIRTMTITQRDAYIVLDYTTQQIAVHRQMDAATCMPLQSRGRLQEGYVEHLLVEKANPLQKEIQHFIDCARYEACRIVSIDAELRSLQVALQVMEILEKDGLV